MLAIASAGIKHCQNVSNPEVRRIPIPPEGTLRTEMVVVLPYLKTVLPSLHLVMLAIRSTWLEAMYQITAMLIPKNHPGYIIYLFYYRIIFYLLPCRCLSGRIRMMTLYQSTAPLRATRRTSCAWQHGQGGSCLQQVSRGSRRPALGLAVGASCWLYCS